MSDITSYEILLIWTRDDYGDNEPTLALVGSNREELEQKLRKYLDDHEKDEDYLDEGEFIELTKDISKLLENRGLEFNCLYESHLMKGY